LGALWAPRPLRAGLLRQILHLLLKLVDLLLQLLPNRGARVAEMSLEDMRTAYEARLRVEPLAARFAAERAKPGDVKRMKAAVAQQRRARSARAVYQAVRDFHLTVVGAAANPSLSRFASSLWAGRIGLHVVLRQADQEALAADAEEHDQILAAIEQSDSALAERLMYEHIAVSLERLAAFVGDQVAAVSADSGD
jgi:DNA-binding GntR family transcriptional regulator